MEFLKNTREWLAPVLTKSAFLERGVLTPEEFVKAGDQLVSCCPNWQWNEGEPSKYRPHLPRGKQYLSTRGVPSYRRVSHMNNTAVEETTIAGGDGMGDDWQAPTLRPVDDFDSDEDMLVDAVDAMVVGSEDSSLAAIEPSLNSSSNVAVSAAPSEDDEYADMEDESLALDAAAIVGSSVSVGKVISTEINGDVKKSAGGTSNILRSRRYDVSITYDKYYQTPRFWLFGYDESGSPLVPEAIFQDVMQDYANKTVTIESHPHISRLHASVHPCQHATAMKRIIDDLAECSLVPSVDQYLFIFLKFIQSVVPTIEYDYTMDVQVGVTVPAAAK